MRCALLAEGCAMFDRDTVWVFGVSMIAATSGRHLG
jgi:hypothetical protein